MMFLKLYFTNTVRNKFNNLCEVFKRLLHAILQVRSMKQRETEHQTNKVFVKTIITDGPPNE